VGAGSGKGAGGYREDALSAPRVRGLPVLSADDVDDATVGKLVVAVGRGRCVAVGVAEVNAGAAELDGFAGGDGLRLGARGLGDVGHALSARGGELRQRCEVGRRVAPPRTGMGRLRGKVEEHRSKPRFTLGQVISTPGALSAIADSDQNPAEFLAQHVTGDWGELNQEDKASNDAAIEHEGDVDRQGRILSEYRTGKGVKIWVISEADRSVTSLLLPEEY
jgi:hypothetical protein